MKILPWRLRIAEQASAAERMAAMIAEIGELRKALAQPVEQPLSDAERVASQCRATASSDIAMNVHVDGGNGTLRELLLDAATALEQAIRSKQA